MLPKALVLACIQPEHHRCHCHCVPVCAHDHRTGVTSCWAVGGQITCHLGDAQSVTLVNALGLSWV